MRRLGILGGLAIVAIIIAVMVTDRGVSEYWRDLATFVSLFLTVLGLGYTVYQVTLIETAAWAAQRAANEAGEESRRRLFQYTAASVHRLIRAITTDIEHREWGKAEIRLDDLADQAAQIGGSVEEWRQLVDGLREAASKCRSLHSGRLKKPALEKWHQLLAELRTRLDAHFGPLQH